MALGRRDELGSMGRYVEVPIDSRLILTGNGRAYGFSP